MKIIDTIKSWFQNIFNRGEIAKALNLPPDALEQSAMIELRDAWMAMYSGTEFKDVKDPRIAATGCAEAARLVVSEMECSAGDSARAKWINEQLGKLLLNRAKEVTEYAAASGGIMIKPRYNGEKLIIDYVSNFYPTQYDNNGIYGCIFVEQKRVGQNTYTRIENHKHKGNNVYEVENLAFKSQSSAVTLGTRINLAEVPEWANIEPIVTVVGAPGPLFVYYKMPGANSVDFNSPLGVSLFSRAVDSIRAATTAYNAIDWEVEGGELKRYRDISTFTKFKDDGTPTPDRKRQKEYIFNGSTGEKEAKLFETFSPELRVESQITALNRHLNQIEAQMGFTQGTFSIDTKTGMATATQVKSDNQKTYSTVNDIQGAFETALGGLIELIDFYATVYNLAPKGEIKPIYNWDDSIIVDAEAERQRDLQEIRDGLMQKWEYRVKWYGEDEKKARSMILDEPTDDNLLDFSTPGTPGNTPPASGGTEVQGKSLNGAQTQSLIAIMSQYSAKQISEGQAINLISTTIGVSKEEAAKILRGEL